MTGAQDMIAEYSLRLTLVLGHFLWQGAVVAALAILTALLLRKTSPRIRYGLFACTLALMAVCPPLTWFALTPAAPAVIASTPMPFAIAEESTAEPTSIVERTASATVPAAAPATQDAQPAPHVESPSVPLSAAAPIPVAATTPALDWRVYTPYATYAYLAGVVLMFFRLIIGLYGGHRLRNQSKPVTDSALLQALASQAERLGMAFTPAIAYCAQVAAPTVVGVVRPIVLLPLSFSSGLTPDQVEMILAHELAHIRRYDHLVNLAQRLIESLLFFHPAVWYISRRVRLEREMCCDDMVIAAGGQRLAYADSLLRVAESAQATAVPGLSAQGEPSQLKRRIVRLVDGRDPVRLRLGRSAFATTIALLALVIGAVVIQSPAQSNTPVDDEKSDDAETRVYDGRLQFRWVLNDDEDGEFVALPAPAHYHADMIRVRKEAIVDERVVSSASVAESESGLIVLTEFSDEGATILRRETEANPGRAIAIVFDGEVLSAPVVHGVIGKSAQITGSLDVAKATKIAKAIGGESVTLPAALAPIDQEDLEPDDVQGNIPFQQVMTKLPFNRTAETPLDLSLSWPNGFVQLNTIIFGASRDNGLDLMNYRFHVTTKAASLDYSDFLVTVTLLDGHDNPLGAYVWRDRIEAGIEFDIKNSTREAEFSSSTNEMAEAFQVTLLRSRSTDEPFRTLIRTHDDGQIALRPALETGQGTWFQGSRNYSNLRGFKVYGHVPRDAQVDNATLKTFVLDRSLNIVKEFTFPIAPMKNTESNWHTFNFPEPVSIPGDYYILLQADAGAAQTGALLIGYNPSPERAHSYLGLPDKELTRNRVGYEWMIHAIVDSPAINTAVRTVTLPPVTQDETRSPVASTAIEPTASVPNPFEGATEVKYDNGVPESFHSTLGQAIAIRTRLNHFLPPEESAGALKVIGFRVYGSRSAGDYNADATPFIISIQNPTGEIVWEERFPYSLFDTEPKWVDILAKNPGRLSNLGYNKGYLTVSIDPYNTPEHHLMPYHSPRNNAGESLSGNVADGFAPAIDKTWMFRLYIADGTPWSRLFASIDEATPTNRNPGSAWSTPTARTIDSYKELVERFPQTNEARLAHYRMALWYRNAGERDAALKIAQRLREDYGHQSDQRSHIAYLTAELYGKLELRDKQILELEKAVAAYDEKGPDPYLRAGKRRIAPGMPQVSSIEGSIEYLKAEQRNERLHSLLSPGDQLADLGQSTEALWTQYKTAMAAEDYPEAFVTYVFWIMSHSVEDGRDKLSLTPFFESIPAIRRNEVLNSDGVSFTGFWVKKRITGTQEIRTELIEFDTYLRRRAFQQWDLYRWRPHQAGGQLSEKRGEYGNARGAYLDALNRYPKVTYGDPRIQSALPDLYGGIFLGLAPEGIEQAEI
jgi:beta-lactamase regulating signal transducer with metallopeptidase domain/tetratricopeptide (TPR) repeat protein